MIEVYSGHRPGQPVLLLTIAATALAGTLGAAWFQVQNRRALAAEVRIPNTPLVVRPPRGWIVDPSDPTSIVLPTEHVFFGRSMWVAERRIRFRYERRRSFYLPELPASQDAPEAARIGPLSGVQVITTRPQRTELGITVSEVVTRVACSPRGDLVTIEYSPLTELTLADLALLGDVAAAVRLDDPDVLADPARLQQRYGLLFDIPAGSSAAAADLPEVAALSVVGQVDGLPAYAISIYRKFLAAGRTPEAVLHDFAATEWRGVGGDLRISSVPAGDGAEALMVRAPGRVSADQPLAAWLVAAGDDAALLLVFADRRFASAADEAARRIATTLRFAPSPLMPPVAAAAAQGRALAAQLSSAEALSGAWGLVPTRSYFVLTAAPSAAVFASGRELIGRSADRGYRGFAIEREPGREAVHSWQSQPDGVGYDWTRDSVEQFGPASQRLTIRERRRKGEDRVSRTRIVGRNTQRDDYPVGPSFVGLPAESIAEFRIANQPDASCLIEVAALDGDAACARLLRALPPDENGLRRVLIQDDFRPHAAILAFDADGELQYQSWAVHRIERIGPQRAAQLHPDLETFIRSRVD